MTAGEYHAVTTPGIERCLSVDPRNEEPQMKRKERRSARSFAIHQAQNLEIESIINYRKRGRRIEAFRHIRTNVKFNLGIVERME